MRRGIAIAIAIVGALIFIVPGSSQPTASLGFVTQFEWQTSDPLSGGLSAIDLSADGTKVTILSDKGAFSTGVIVRDKDDMITDIALDPFRLLKGRDAAPLAYRRQDSEGLAIDAAGTVFISFEGAVRVLRYADIAGSAENLPTPGEFKRFKSNKALEALAVDTDGALYTLPEEPIGGAAQVPIFRFRSGAWDARLVLPLTDDFLPVGADFGPDGLLYILFRRFHGFRGFSSRLARTTVGDEAIGPLELMFETDPGFHGNLEGVSIWRDRSGHLRATMIADDNFLPFLSSGIVEYRLPD